MATTNYVSAFNVGDNKIEIQAAKVEWEALTGITAASGDAATSTTGILPPDHVAALIKEATSTVYHVKGSASVTQINELKAPEIGDVYNVSGPGEINVKPDDTKTKISVIAGDNVVYTDEGWDKLAGTVDLTSYATTGWVNSAADVTVTVSSTSGYWNTAYNAITGAISTSGAMVTNTTPSAIATSDAITAYVEGAVAGKIVDEIKADTPSDAIPDAKAVSAYVAASAMSAGYNTVIIYDGAADPQVTSANKLYDAFALSAGKNMELTPVTDKLGHPTIAISNTAVNPAIAATSGITAEAQKDSAENITGYSISGVQATDTAVGVNYAPYYVEGVIYFNTAKA